MQESAILNGGAWTAGVSFRPGSILFANSNWSGEVRLWNTTTQKIQAKLQAHDQNIPCIAFSPDGQFLATASADGSVKVWDFFPLPATPIAGQIGLGDVSVEVKRLADVLASHEPPLVPTPARGCGSTMKDLVGGRTTSIDHSSRAGLLSSRPGLVPRRHADCLPRGAAIRLGGNQDHRARGSRRPVELPRSRGRM